MNFTMIHGSVNIKFVTWIGYVFFRIQFNIGLSRTWQ